MVYVHSSISVQVMQLSVTLTNSNKGPSKYSVLVIGAATRTCVQTTLSSLISHRTRNFRKRMQVMSVSDKEKHTDVFVSENNILLYKHY